VEKIRAILHFPNQERKVYQISLSPGSVLVADFYATSFVTGVYSPGMKTSLNLLKITDEELEFGIDFSCDFENALKTFLDSENMQTKDTYFMGYKTKKGSYMVVAEILI
jgi:hypothetical protein